MQTKIPRTALPIKMFNGIITAALAICCLTACATTTYNENFEKIVSISLEDLNSSIESMETVSITELLNSSRDLRPMESDLKINTEAAKAIKIKGKKYLARAFKINSGTTKIIEIKSYVVPVKEKADYLFFPSITNYDSSKIPLGELHPDDGYSIVEGVLDLTFTIPAETSYVLIHTKQEYLSMGSIDGAEGGLSPDVNYFWGLRFCPDTLLCELMGGVGEAVQFGADQFSSFYNYGSAPPENFFFGPGGILLLRVYEQN